jgi:AbrB family looped-hinge helix DNA binding protein
MKTVIDDAGRVQLPENVRAQLGVRPGDEVVWEERAGEWVIKSAHAATGLSWEGNVLVHKGTSPATVTIEELIDEGRNERFRQLTEGLTK